MAINLASSLKGCRSWDDLQRRWKDCDKKKKGDLFEALVKNYLLLTPEFASKFKAVWGFKEIPSSVFQKLKLPSSDKGIDLIAETKEGDYWAIQCKYREDPSDQITWREISTFMGLYLGRKQISFGLIASTTERITKVLKDHDRVGFLAYDTWQGLDEEFFKRLQARLYKKKEPLKAHLPRPHQKEAIRDAVAYFKKRGNSRGKLIMPCGTGKSLTSYFIAQKLKARKILIAVPSLSLIKQTLKAWMYESMARKQDVEWICICSDESAGSVEQDDAVVLKQDLGVPCLTNSKEIAEWLKRRHNSLAIVFTTYQSGEALAKAARKAGFNFDLGIMDEAHKTAGAKDRLFSHLILDKNIKINRRLFMTATERRYRGESDEILSMEDSDDYGETIHKLSFKKALEYKPPILSDYKVVTIHISKEEIVGLVRNRAFVRPKMKGWGKEMEAENLAALIALRKAMSKYPIRHAVSFHGSIKRAQDFQESNDAYSKSFPSSVRLQTFHVSGKTPTGTRSKEIDQFSKAPRSLITNARCLTEGVDVPNIDAVLFADPRRSLVDIVQAVGRALRPSPNKKFGYVIVPVVHEKNAKPDDILESDSFQEVLTTLRALGSQDDRLIEYFRSISQGKYSKNRRPLEDMLTEKLAKKIDLKDFAKSIELRCWDRLAKLSWMPFHEAKTYIHQLGLKSGHDWYLYYTGKIKTLPRKPADIPAAPATVYSDRGWAGMGDWLGTGNTADQFKKYLPFKKARSFARKLELKSGREWSLFLKGKIKNKPKLPPDIPADPRKTYTRLGGWLSMGDWLGSGVQAPYLIKYAPFKKARSFVWKLKLKSGTEWRRYCKGLFPGKTKKPKNIPANPDSVYKGKGFRGMGDWLGTGALATRNRSYLPFRKARRHVRALKLKSRTDWLIYTRTKRSEISGILRKIPTKPERIYKNRGWISMGDWLGTGTVAPQKRKYRAFKKAKKFVRALCLKNHAEWLDYTKGNIAKKPKLPNDIPTKPSRVYKNSGWAGLGDWLGTGVVANQNKQYWPFVKARKYVRALKLKNQPEWDQYKKNKLKTKSSFCEKLPQSPRDVYLRKGWKGWGDFLGNGSTATFLRRYMSFRSARALVREQLFKNRQQYLLYIRQNTHWKLHSTPDRYYKGKGWRGWGDFLGKKSSFIKRKVNSRT